MKISSRVPLLVLWALCSGELALAKVGGAVAAGGDDGGGGMPSSADGAVGGAGAVEGGEMPSSALRGSEKGKKEEEEDPIPGLYYASYTQWGPTASPISQPGEEGGLFFWVFGRNSRPGELYEVTCCRWTGESYEDIRASSTSGAGRLVVTGENTFHVNMFLFASGSENYAYSGVVDMSGKKKKKGGGGGIKRVSLLSYFDGTSFTALSPYKVSTQLGRTACPQSSTVLPPPPLED